MVTLREVAEAAGVSISTVSRALSEPGRVAEPTRRRIRAVVAELGYTPNRAASLLRSGRTGALGLIVPDLENPYFSSITKGVQERALDLGLSVLVADSDENMHREHELVEALSRQSDGLIICSPRNLQADLERLDGSLAVLVNAESPGVPSVTIDYADAMRRAVAHLRALGHRRIAYVGGPEQSRSDRLRRDGLDQAAHLFPDVDIADLGAFRPQMVGGEAAADLAVGAGVSAVIAFNDLVALGLLARLAKRGLALPDDMSVVGCDDTFVALLATPQLTTIRTDIRGQGATAVDVLQEAAARDEADPGTDLGGGPGDLRRELPVELIVRSSTVALPEPDQRR